MNIFAEARSRPRLHETPEHDSSRGTLSVDSIFQPMAPASSAGNEDGREERGGSSHNFELQVDPSFWKDHNVQVIIRIRPLSDSEISLQGFHKCVRQDNYQTITWTGHPESRFTFDLVADEHVSQEKLFMVAGVPMVENCMSGYNSCMFAYGQTGSGKTHTMLGDMDGGKHWDGLNCGMTPRVFEYLFSRIQKEKDARRDENLKFCCRISFLEIYNEQILDLLDPSSTCLQLREDAKKGVYVENVKELVVSSARDVIKQLVQGAANRKVATTNMNRASSRSHSVFTCVIESKWESQGVTHHRFSRLNLVDLAGSERQKSTGAEGERLKEATNINKSLSTLGLVIMNLVSVSHGKSLHIPYRDSKLTFLLQESLGGNSKTIIIANISPSNCCALETLSSLKFAQRAKFIRNNAVVNEDSCGDVLIMRMKIQQLKKEVSHLRGLLNGGTGCQETDNFGMSFSGPLELAKCDELLGPSSPLTFMKQTSKGKDDEVALVGVLKRVREKEIELDALATENEAAKQLARKREEEIQCLKMRLRFREETIKRLEEVVSGRMSVETHLLQEKSELLKEIDTLRCQADRNQEVTRFAMENLRLSEEIRKLKLFYEDGERERLNEEIRVIQSKLLEALDWKLMHKKDPEIVQGPSMSPTSWGASSSMDAEFFQLQVVQNEKELATLRQNFGVCFEAKEKLERRVNELELQLGERRKLNDTSQETYQHSDLNIPEVSTKEISLHNAQNDQMELQVMVDTIAAASQREAEAHEMAITLARENEELGMKIKLLIQDNNRLTALYGGAIIEATKKQTSGNVDKQCAEVEIVPENSNLEAHHEDWKQTEILEQQLHEMHEENEKLMRLFEKAMQERDDFKRMLVEAENQTGFGKVGGETKAKLLIHELEEEGGCSAHDSGIRGCECETRSKEALKLARLKLEVVEDKLAKAAEAFALFGLLTGTSNSLVDIWRDLQIRENRVQLKQKEISYLKNQIAEIEEKEQTMDKKLLALKVSASNFASSVDYWVGREARAKARLDTASHFVAQKQEELSHLQTQKSRISAACTKVLQTQRELKSHLASLKFELQTVENQRRSEKVLFEIDNLDKANIAMQRNSSLTKAVELLKSEEDRTKLSAEIRRSKERLISIQKEVEGLEKMSGEVDAEMQGVLMEVAKASSRLGEADLALENIMKEKETLSEMRESGVRAIQHMIVEYQSCLFELSMKNSEVQLCEEELTEEIKRLEELKWAQMAEVEQRVQVLTSNECCAQLEAQEELQEVQKSISDVMSLLGITVLKKTCY